MMHTRTLAVLGGLLLASSACEMSTTVPDLNNVSSEQLAGGLSRGSTGLLVTGLLDRTRGDLDTRFMVFTQTLGRDLVQLDNNEPRYVIELLTGPADFSSFVGGGAFTQFYTTINTANTLINGMANATGLTDQEKSAVKGLAKTFKALAYYRALETRDSLGIATDVDHPITDPPAPFVCKPNALAFISALLDDAATDLAAGGTAFPTALPSGFTSNGKFDTPATFLKFNRGLKGKVELYRALDHQKPNAASLAAALTALNASFIDRTATPAALAVGVYNTYSTAAGETSNPLAAQGANIYLNNGVAANIQTGDLRAAKITTVTTKTQSGVSSSYKSPLTDPSALTRPIPVLRNAELLLLRAQVYIEQNDLTNAALDINAVRTGEGGSALPLFVPTTKAAAITAVLYEKRYSLLTESAHRIVDLRAYDRLNAANGGFTAETGDVFQAMLPIPKRELDARGVTSITPACP